MLSSSRFIVAVHAMSVLARFQGKGPVCSALVAQSVHTNPVVIRRLMTELERAGLVKSVAGRSGGFALNRDPGRITLASAGSGTNSHLAGELFQLQSGTKFIHVPYKGGAPALIDVMGGQVEFTFDQLSSSVPFIRAGKIRALGITALERSALLPEVPTIHEAGLKGFEASTYTGIMLPGATPKDIVQKIQGTLVRVLDRPATKEAFAKLGADVLKSTPEEFSRKLKADLGKWAEVKKRADIRID